MSKPLFKQVEEKQLLKEELEHSWVVRNSTLTADEIFAIRTVDGVRNEVQSIFDAHQFMCAYNDNFDFSFMRAVGLGYQKQRQIQAKLVSDKVDHRGQRRFYKMDELYQPDVQLIIFR